MASIADLKFISSKTLSERILEQKEATDPTLAVVDVRDDGKAHHTQIDRKFCV